MQIHSILIASLIFAGGCKKHGNDTAQAASAAAPKTTEPAASACPAGAYTDKDHGFCVQLGAGWKLTNSEPRGNYVMTEFGIDKYDSRITVTTYPKNDTTYDSELESKKGLGNPTSPGEKKIADGDLPGGVGYFYEIDMGNDIDQGETVVKNPKGSPVECYVNKGSDKFKDAMEACKTLRPL
ncbi:MAG TPA: hypothetical protein VGL61_34865 [Kofleriaceae bacterium]